MSEAYRIARATVLRSR